LASIVDALHEAIWVAASVGSDRTSPFSQNTGDIIFQALLAGIRSQGRRFRNAHYLSAVIDSAGLPLFPPSVGRPSCGRLAKNGRHVRLCQSRKVFTVRIWNRCSDKPTASPRSLIRHSWSNVLSSKRAEVDVDPWMFNTARHLQWSSRSKCGGLKPIHVLCPAAIIESMTMLKLSLLLLVPKSVTL